VNNKAKVFRGNQLIECPLHNTTSLPLASGTSVAWATGNQNELDITTEYKYSQMPFTTMWYSLINNTYKYSNGYDTAAADKWHMIQCSQ